MSWSFLCSPCGSSKSLIPEVYLGEGVLTHMPDEDGAWQRWKWGYSVRLESCIGRDEETNQALLSAFWIVAFLATVQRIPEKPHEIFLDHALFTAYEVSRANDYWFCLWIKCHRSLKVGLEKTMPWFWSFRAVKVAFTARSLEVWEDWLTLTIQINCGDTVVSKRSRKANRVAVFHWRSGQLCKCCELR